MKLWVGNLAPDTTTEEVKRMLDKYGFPEAKGVQPVPGDDTQPGMVVDFEGVNPELIRRLLERVEDLFWKGRHTSVTVLPHF